MRWNVFFCLTYSVTRWLEHFFYFVVSNSFNLPNGIKHLPKEVYNLAKCSIALQKWPKYFQNFAKPVHSAHVNPLSSLFLSFFFISRHCLTHLYSDNIYSGKPWQWPRNNLLLSFFLSLPSGRIICSLDEEFKPSRWSDLLYLFAYRKKQLHSHNHQSLPTYLPIYLMLVTYLVHKPTTVGQGCRTNGALEWASSTLRLVSLKGIANTKVTAARSS